VTSVHVKFNDCEALTINIYIHQKQRGKIRGLSALFAYRYTLSPAGFAAGSCERAVVDAEFGTVRGF
jgi:hypothetical protein